jgi:hypothetical protein
MELSSSTSKGQNRSEGIFINLLRACLFGTVLGYLLGLILSRSVWLEMRFNLGLMIPVCTLACMFLSTWKRITLRYSVFLFLELLTVVTFLFICRLELDALLIIPASLFREGFSLTMISLDFINIILGFILFAGNFIWIFHDIDWKSRRRTSCRMGRLGFTKIAIGESTLKTESEFSLKKKRT